MQITDLVAGVEGGVARAEATVTWEEAQRPPLRLFVETDAAVSSDLAPDPNGLLVAALLPAWHAGERRLAVEGAVCPVLRDNLGVAAATLQAWYPELGPAPAVEPTRGYRARPPTVGRAAVFLSMGIDSLATLRMNRLNLPRDHPGSIRSALLVDLIQEPGLSEGETAHQHRKRMAGASRVTEEADLEAISLRTNLLQLDTDGWFFSYKWHGAAFAALAHFLSAGIGRAYLAASYHALQAGCWGSHPLLDPNYGAEHLRVDHHGGHLTRFDKVALVADWPVALGSLLVCQGGDSGPTNCGACEKCIRTMTALAALGKLGQSDAFPLGDVGVDLLATTIEYGMVRSRDTAQYYAEMVPALLERGREDLAAVVQRLVATVDTRSIDADSWLRGLDGALPDRTKVVVDGEHHHGPLPGGSRGRYWAPSLDDGTAIRELEALRAWGAECLVFRPEGAWWLDHCPRFAAYLEASYRRLPVHERLTAFDLGADRPGGGA